MPTVTAGYIEAVTKYKQTASDGSGGSLNKYPKFRHAGAGVGLCFFENGTLRIDVIIAKVLGNQTTPRAEGWGVDCHLYVWCTRNSSSPEIEITIVVDATYIINAFKPHKRRSMMNAKMEIFGS